MYGVTITDWPFFVTWSCFGQWDVRGNYYWLAVVVTWSCLPIKMVRKLGHVFWMELVQVGHLHILFILCHHKELEKEHQASAEKITDQGRWWKGRWWKTDNKIIRYWYQDFKVDMQFLNSYNNCSFLWELKLGHVKSRSWSSIKYIILCLQRAAGTIRRQLIKHFN